MRRGFANVSLLFALGFGSGCALTQGTVTRVADGVEREGRPVSDDAYAYYSRGVMFESKGDAPSALLAYRAALAEDPTSPELHARIGSVECGRAHSEGDEATRRAEQNFTRALELDPASSTAWALAARCAARTLRRRDALARALKAAMFDPSSVPLSLLVVEYAEAASDMTTARAWIEGLVVSAPTSREALQAFAAFSQRHGARGAELAAERALGELGVKSDASSTLERALARGNLVAARRAALELRLRASELALRAVRESTSSVATEQALLALGADPSDADAFVAALAAADLSGDRAAFERLLGEAPTAPSTPNPLALELLRELLARLVGDDAVAAWNAPAKQVSEKDH